MIPHGEVGVRPNWRLLANMTMTLTDK